MQEPQELQQGGDQQPEIENEAIKSSELIGKDKKNKEPVADEDFPGYPHYPASEDILNPSSEMERVEADVENITRAGNIADRDLGAAPAIPAVNDMEQPVTDDVDDDEDDLEIVLGTEADVTREDLMLLGPKDQDMDMGEDEELLNKGYPLGMTGDDLDVPEEDQDEDRDSMGQGDEENDYYSLGGDNKESLEEDPSGNL